VRFEEDRNHHAEYLSVDSSAYISVHIPKCGAAVERNDREEMTGVKIQSPYLAQY